MIPWGRGVPDWRSLSGLGPRIPGIQAVMLSEGAESIEYEGLAGLDWECCGLYTIRVNGGGLRAEEPLEPTRSLKAPLGRFEPWRCPLEYPARGVGKVLVNPLGWRPVAPRIGVRGTTCIEAGGIEVGLIQLEPLATGLPSRCVRARSEGAVELLGLGPHRLEFRGRLWSYGVMRVVEGTSGLAAESRGAAALDAGDGVSIRLGFYDYEAYLLYPLHYRLVGRVRAGDRIEVEALSIYVRGPGGGLGLSSINGLKATMAPGRIEVEGGSLTVTLGSETIAYRALIEHAVEWRPLEAPEDGLGHVRVGPGAPVLVDACGREMVFLLQNPSLRDGVFEARIRAPVRRIEVSSPLGSLEVPAPGGLFRVPMPRGYVGVARVTLGSGLLARLRKSGGPGRFIQPV